MRKARKPLSILIIACLLLSATAAYAAPDGETAVPSASGTWYTVGPAGGETDAALTAVDHRFDGGGTAEYGVRYDGNSQYYYGAEISGVTYGVVIDSAGTGYFGSSDGTIPLYDPSGAMTGVVWGDCRPTDISCQTGFLVRGDVAACILVEDGSSVHAQDALIVYESGVCRILFNNARLGSDSGVLLDTAENADGQLTLSFSNGCYTGDLHTGPAALSVCVGKGALLHGDVAPAGDGQTGAVDVTVAGGGTWVPEKGSRLDRLCVEDGAAVYGVLEEDDSGALSLLPGDTLIEAGVYEREAASPLTEQLPFGHGPAVSDAVADAFAAADLTVAAGVMQALFTDVNARVDVEGLSAVSGGLRLGQGVLAGLTARDPAAAVVTGALRAAVAKSHSFTTETLDKRSRILYNPYCCLAA